MISLVDKKGRRLLVAALVTFGAASPVGRPSVAWAQDEADEPSPEARAANEEALKASAAGDYPEALRLFQKAYDISPSYVILYNIGRMSRLTGDDKRSLDAFTRYLEEGGEGVDADRRKEVEKEIAALDKLVGRLSITVSAEGATVTVDDVVVGKSPLAEPVIVNAGKHRIRATKEGEATPTQEFEVGRGATLEVELVLDDDTPAVPETEEGFELPGAGVPSAILWTMWIGTALFAVGAGATGTIALIESGNLEDSSYASQPGYGPPRDSDILARRDRLHALAVTTNWLIVGAVVVGTSAIYLTIASATENEEPAAAVGLGLDGVQLKGSF